MWCNLALKMNMEKRLLRQYDALLTAMQRQRTVVLKHLVTNRNADPNNPKRDSERSR